MNPTARRNARYYALQALYQWQIAQTPISEIETDFLIQHIRKKNTDRDFFRELVQSVPKIVDELDHEMEPFLSRSLQELDPVELTILRLGIYELLHRPDIPYRVSINESLELTKQFGSVEGYKFVNGILDQVAHKIRQLEISADKKRK